MGLRPYQQRIVDDAMNEYTNYTRPFVVDAFQACLAGDTKVLTPDGYRAIKNLHEGDIVGSWNGEAIEWNEIECRSITRSSHSPKPMLELEYEDYDTTGKKIKRHCKTTYDHRFFDGTKYYPLYQLVWGDMEESQRVQLEILCKQYGQDFNHTIQGGISCWDNTASEGCQRVSQDGAGQEDGEGSSSNRSNFYSKSSQQTDSEPYQWEQNGQPSIESGMGDSIRTGGTYAEDGTLDKREVREYEGGTSITTSNDRRTTDVVVEGMGKQNSRSNAKTEDHSIQRIVSREQRPVQSFDACATEECHPEPYRLSAIRVCEAEDYYAITVKHCHSYIIEGGFPTHNSGKSWMIAEIAKRVGKCLILCMNKELVEQDAEKIKAVGAECSIYSASCGEKVISNITVATIGSIYKHPEYCQHFNLVIVDEADQVPVDKKDSMYMKLFHQIKKPVMGWTGTAFRTAYNYNRLKNGDVVQSTVIKSLDNFNFWGKVVGGVTYQELLDEEFVSPIQYYVEDTNMSMLRVNSTGLDYTEDSLEKYGGANRMRLVQVVRGAVNVWKCKRVLVAVPNIEEAERVAEMLRADGVSAESLHSQMSKKERTRIVEHFKEGTIQVVVQVLILNVGFDLPALDCVIFARPSLSLRIWCQFCYTKSMNILTPSGFLSCDDVHEGDLVYAYNIETGKIEATPILEKIERPLMDGEKVYQYKNSHIDVSMTENHDLVYRARRAKHWKKDQLRTVMDEMMDCYEVPVAGFETPHGVNSLTDYELKLIGWFLSDGYVEKNTNRVGISQADSNKEYVKEIKEILDKLNIGYTFTKSERTGELSKYSPCNHFRFSKRTNKPGKRGAGFLWEWLDKTMSHECFESLTHDQLKIIMETMFKGDGAKQRTIGGPKGSYAICIGDKPFAEKLQSLLVRRGFSAKITTYKSRTGWSNPNKELKMLYYSEKTTRILNGKNVLRRNALGESIQGRKYKRTSWELEEYTGNVWCVRTKLGTTIMERNGKVIIAGNCARGIRLDPDDKTKTCKCIDMGGMIKLYGRIEDVKVKGGKVIGTHGYISDKVLNKVNVSEMARRFN